MAVMIIIMNNGEMTVIMKMLKIIKKWLGNMKIMKNNENNNSMKMAMAIMKKAWKMYQWKWHQWYENENNMSMK